MKTDKPKHLFIHNRFMDKRIEFYSETHKQHLGTVSRISFFLNPGAYGQDVVFTQFQGWDAELNICPDTKILGESIARSRTAFIETLHALMSTALTRDGKLIVYVDKAGRIALNGVYPPEEAIYFHEGE